MAAHKTFEIAIIGGGIAGITLAIGLHARQIPFTIYEQAHKFGEIGAGISFGPNAVKAMQICDHVVYEAFERVCTRNEWPSKQKVWFDFLNGYDKSSNTPGHQDAIFSITTSLGQNGVHRAKYLDELVKQLPSDVAKFGKRLEKVTEDADTGGKLVLHFADGSKATADAVIGCDGIKSRVRAIMFGDNHPCAHPTYTHKYAYRGLVPMEEAIAAVGEERAKNACMHVGPDNHVLTFSVNHGEILNIVAFHTDPNDWPDYQKLTRPAKREDALRDFESFGPNVTALLKLTKPDLDCWAIFDLAANPVPSFNSGRLCIAGDASHATSPHHGAGAGLCIEDSAVMATLLADEGVKSQADLAAVFAAFDHNRRERGQWLVQSSRISGDVYEWRNEEIGHDFEKMEREINRRNNIIGGFDVEAGCKAAVAELQKLLSSK